MAPVIQNGVDDRADAATRRTLNNAVKLNLIPVSRKVSINFNKYSKKVEWLILLRKPC